jgi:signal transduction histidine kinase
VRGWKPKTNTDHSMCHRGVRAHFDVAVAMITVIPFLCVLALSSPDIKGFLNMWGRAIVFGIGFVVSPILGYIILARYPAAIIKLRDYLGDIVRGELPDEVDLLTDEVDVQAVEHAVNAILGRLKDRVQRVTAVNDQLQDALLQSRKLEAVGTLAYGVAHEIATPLQIVRSNHQFICEVSSKLIAAKDSQLAVELRACTIQAESAIDDISTTLTALRDFAPQGRRAPSRALTDLNDIIRTTVALTRNEWKYAAEVHFDCDESVRPIMCAPGELKQVVVNLTMNAVQAIQAQQEARGDKEKGRIRFTTRSVAEGVAIEVSDNGCGMSTETVPRVFDPFFSAGGNGLQHGRGLSLAYASIVHDHAGSITCSSTQGEGTTIRFTLPLEKGWCSNERQLAVA